MKRMCTAILSVLFAAGAFSGVPVGRAAPEISARSYLVMDVTANRVLAQKDIDRQMEPASLTKLMTAYLVFDALKDGRLSLDQTLPVSERAWRMTGSRMFINPRMKVPVEDLIKGLLVQSGNDAAVALAEGLDGSVEEFVGRMNAQARRLGMKNTHFKSPDGLPMPGHVTSARDLGILATRLLRDFPTRVGYFGIRRYHYDSTPVSNEINRNTLLFRDRTVDGFKTGYTEAAGYCIVASAMRPSGSRREPHRLVVVVLGAPSKTDRIEEAQSLLDWGYKQAS